MNQKFRSWAALVLIAVVMSFSTALAQRQGSDGVTEIPVIVTQPQSVTLAGEETYTLFVEATVSDGNTLVYQWFASTSEDKTDILPLSSSSSLSENFYTVSGSDVAMYYFVTVTNITKLGGKAWVESNAARVIGTKRANAVAPFTYLESQIETTIVGKYFGRPLKVHALAIDGGTLSYQWFGSTDRKDTAGWTPIEGATTESYALDASKAGTFYYRVVVTNTNTRVDGEKTASRTSYVVEVRVEEAGVNYAKFPSVSEPKAVKVEKEGDTAAATLLSVEAESPDGGTLSYQWYRTPYDSDVGGEPIEGATGATFDLNGLAYSPPEAYYYVEVTNTKADGDDKLTAVITSNPATVLTGVAGEWLAVQTHDRVIPQTNAGTETAAIAPVSRLTTELTAGPNPAGRSSGAVNFFRTGSRIASASLSVYDASGNAVKKITVRDAAPTQSKRRVGSWDLADRKGRPVSDGTYLLKGIIKTADGKSEKVSAAVGVR